jgi:hypothetical protein
MPSKRRTLDRPRRQTFTTEIVALFVEIERLRGNQAFTDRSHDLARMLGLTEQWWTGNHVNDRSAGPIRTEEYSANEHWRQCRRVREELLAAVKQDKAARPEVGDVLDLRPDPAQP